MSELKNKDAERDAERRRQADGADAAAPARVLGFSKRTKIIFGGGVALALAALTVFLALQYITPHYTVNELLTRPVTPPDELIAVEGVLAPGSYSQSADGLVATFRLTDEGGGDTVEVTYGTQAGAEVGQLFFNEHSTILVQGRKTAQASFEASRLTVKCPTKYQSDAEGYEETYSSET